ncbi:MAG: 30S ribosomal protein S12 methylthiotransferase RimO [Lachnospiraceae bacterium]
MKIMFVSLGCDKNLVDSEMMLGLLAARGYTFTDDRDQADVFVVNTCCFIHDAKEESIETILELAGYKEHGCCKALVVTGCLAQRYAQEMLREIPEVDAIVGTSAYDRIPDAIERALLRRDTEEAVVVTEPLSRLPLPKTTRILTTGGHSSYLKIAEGCDKRCTYCVIPSVRGPYRSVPMEELVRQATEMCEQGVRELILVAQETTMYGKDLYGEKKLPELLRKLAAIPQLMWIRLLYCYPEEITPELVHVIRQEPKICHYLDLPIQHCNDEILKRMGRRTDKKQLLETIAYLRREIPDIVLRTTLIAGFPGETQEQFEELAEFIQTVRFERLGVFTYSAEENTPAAAMDGQISEHCKQTRRDRLMEIQQEISFEHTESLTGRKLSVFVEGKLVDEPVYVGRTYMDTPDVDGYFFLNTEEELISGEFVQAQVTGALDYDLVGVPVAAGGDEEE